MARYFENANTGKFISMDDNPPDDWWIEIEQDEYESLCNPLSRPTLHALDDCPRCGGRGTVRNDGFVWVACPACSGNRQ